MLKCEFLHPKNTLWWPICSIIAILSTFLFLFIAVCVHFNLFITHWEWFTDYAQAKKAEEVSEDFTPCVFVSWFATVWLSDDVRILLPSARQSASLFVQGLRKVSVRSLAVLFCLSVSFATSPPSRRHVFWAGMAGWELSKLPAASHASCLAVTRRDGRHSTQLVKSTLMLGWGGKKGKKCMYKKFPSYL